MIIKTFECPSIQLHKRFNLQAYRYIVIQVCDLLLKNESYEGITLNL